MSNVTLSIGGREFVVASADGEEHQVEKLGRMIDDRLRNSGHLAGQSEVRMLLFAALILADELAEAQNGATPAAEAPAVRDQLAGLVAERVSALAERIEKLAAALEGPDESA